jgi:hypothetical protein
MPVVLKPIPGQRYWWHGFSEGCTACCPHVADDQTFKLEPCDTADFISVAPITLGGDRLKRESRSVGPANVPLPVPFPVELPLMYRHFWLEDTMAGSPCTPRVATDGVLRCLPVETYERVAIHFADAACTEPILINPLDRPVAAGPAPTGSYVGRWINGRYAVHTVTGDAQPTHFYYDAGAGCFEIPRPLAYGMSVGFSALSPEVPPAQFVAVTISE